MNDEDYLIMRENYTQERMQEERNALESHFGPSPGISLIQDEYSNVPLSHLYEWLIKNEEDILNQDKPKSLHSLITIAFVHNCLTWGTKITPTDIESRNKNTEYLIRALVGFSRKALRRCKNANLY